MIVNSLELTSRDNQVPKGIEMIRNKKIRKPARKPRHDRLYGRLKPLVEFLNFDIDHARQETVSTELNLRIYYDLSPDGNRDHLRLLKKDLIEALQPIARLPEGGSERFKPSKRMQNIENMDAWLKSLIDRINRMRFNAQFRVFPGVKEVPLISSDLFGFHVRNAEEKPTPDVWGTYVKNPVRRLLNFEQGIFSWGEGKWMVKMDFSAGLGYSPERDFYGIIAEGLMTGELARLRQCAYCQVFFVAQQPRVTFCPGHARKYYDMLKSHPEMAVSAN